MSLTLPPARDGGARILIVDDEGVTRMMLRRVLEDYGYRVLEAQDGQTAARLADTEAPDLVLMDVRMPVMNGFDACRTIRRSLRSGHTPVLMLTALDDVMAVTLAFEAGATDFITKPINWALLAQRVRYALRTSATERELRESQLALARAQKIARLGQWRLDFDSGRIHCSRELRDLLGLAVPDGLTAADLLAQLAPEDRARLRRFVRDIRRSQREREVEVRLSGPATRALPVRYLFLSGDVVLDENGQPCAIFGVAQDVSERREAEARLSYYAHFDTLTGLPNRVLFRDRVATAIAASQQDGRPFAVMNIAVDLLHRTQASVAQTASDRILKAVTARLESVLREREPAPMALLVIRVEGLATTEARLGVAAAQALRRKLAVRLRGGLRASDVVSALAPDAFAVVLTRLDAPADGERVAAKLAQVLREPFMVSGQTTVVTVSTGVAVYPGHGKQPDDLLKLALSMAAARRGLGRQGYADRTERGEQSAANDD